MPEQDMPMEWRDIPGFPGYEASACGRIRGPRGVLRKTKPDADGYPSLGLYQGGRARWKCVHQVVALAWLGPKPSPRHEVAHWDGDRTNNAAANLRWATSRENKADQARHGTRRVGQAHHAAKLTEDAVRNIRVRLARGERRAALAREYSVGYYAIAKVASGRRWQHVATP